MIDYLQWKKSCVASSSLPNYERWVKRFNTFLNKDTITLDDTSRFKIHLLDKGYSPKNIQYGLSLVRDYLNYQVTMHKLDFPLALFRIKQERSKSHYALTEAEYRRMLAVLPENEPLSLQRKLLLSFLWDTGMRGGELLRLRYSDINGSEAVIMNEKNHRSRLIAWSAESARLLKRYLPLRRQLPSLKGDDFLFISFKYRPCRKLTTRQLERIVMEIRKKAHIRNTIRPHSFRHGFVHRQLREGRPITTISQMLGHSTANNVIAYAQLSSKEIREAWKYQPTDRHS